MVAEWVVRKWMAELEKIKPRSIVYLFSAGKDSSLALLLTRDVVKRYAEESGAKVYIVHIVIPGNSHPANTYCASYIMLWHKQHYDFEPIWLTKDMVFQELVQRYGLQIGAQRWCFIRFKEELLRKLHARLPKPSLHIDGMSPRDSRRRAEMIKGEFELVKTWNRDTYWAWHPLYNVDLSSEEKLRLLEQHEEFKCVVRLYREYGDSLNCVLCPYKLLYNREKVGDELTAWTIGEFLKLATRSERVHCVIPHLQTPSLTRWIKGEVNTGG